MRRVNAFKFRHRITRGQIPSQEVLQILTDGPDGYFGVVPIITLFFFKLVFSIIMAQAAGDGLLVRSPCGEPFRDKEVMPLIHAAGLPSLIREGLHQVGKVPRDKTFLIPAHVTWAVLIERMDEDAPASLEGVILLLLTVEQVHEQEIKIRLKIEPSGCFSVPHTAANRAGFLKLWHL